MAIHQRMELHNYFVGLTNLVFSVIMLLLGLRFVFRLFAANSVAPFVSWIYNTTDELIYPFRGIFPSPVVDGSFVFDVTTLVALVIYALIFSFFIYLFDVAFGIKRIDS